jgi:hypothetical protein
MTHSKAATNILVALLCLALAPVVLLFLVALLVVYFPHFLVGMLVFLFVVAIGGPIVGGILLSRKKFLAKGIGLALIACGLWSAHYLWKEQDQLGKVFMFFRSTPPPTKTSVEFSWTKPLDFSQPHALTALTGGKPYFNVGGEISVSLELVKNVWLRSKGRELSYSEVEKGGRTSATLRWRIGYQGQGYPLPDQHWTTFIQDIFDLLRDHLQNAGEVAVQLEHLWFQSEHPWLAGTPSGQKKIFVLQLPMHTLQIWIEGYSAQILIVERSDPKVVKVSE